jgi:dTDP-4-dehydrorhamnose 3,5-epimerase
MPLTRLRATGLEGLFEVLPCRHRDERGAFTRTWCAADFAGAGIRFVPQLSAVSDNTAAFTLRGLHWQEEPAAQQKLVQCVRGRVFDVAVDVRPGSPTRWQHRAALLDASLGNALFIPRGFAHGFLTLVPGAAVAYLIDAPHAPGLARGLRWDDPLLAIPWPEAPQVLSARDSAWPACHA